MSKNSLWIIDVHSHIHFSDYDKDREEAINRAKNGGIKMITVGVNIPDSARAIKLAHSYPEDIWATVGFHPSDIGDNEFDVKKFEELAKDNKVVAIGECGLDYFRIKKDDFKNKEEQKKIFLQQARIAEKIKKPIMIHCRPSKGTNDAYEDLLEIIEKNKFIVTMISHFYAGNLETAKKMFKKGFYFTFGGVITFSRDYDDVIKYLPLDRIMLETDAPYVTPEPYRGKRNEPVYVLEVAKKLSEIKNLELAKLLGIVNKNTKTVFGI